MLGNGSLVSLLNFIFENFVGRYHQPGWVNRKPNSVCQKSTFHLSFAAAKNRVCHPDRRRICWKIAMSRVLWRHQYVLQLCGITKAIKLLKLWQHLLIRTISKKGTKKKRKKKIESKFHLKFPLINDPNFPKSNQSEKKFFFSSFYGGSNFSDDLFW